MTSMSEAPDRRALLHEALVKLEAMQARLEASEAAQREPIAILGMGCRFPGGANDPQAFWRLLEAGRDAVTAVPPERWDIDAYYDADPEARGKMYTRFSAFLDHVPDKFDAAFFGISPREAMALDPQQRLLLEVAWEALEHAGIAPQPLAASQTGVFLGISTNDYAFLQGRLGGVETYDAYFGSGVAHSTAAGRLSYTLGVHGPCLAVDTACSSSLVAVHLACQSLRLRECDLALAGGVNLIVAPEGAIMTSRGHMLAADGHCKTFDAAADGYVRGEGCGLIVLKRLADAVADGDNILAVIRGTAINQDGRSNGLTAPHGPSQEAVIRAALANAGLEPGAVGYHEAHGTGTSLGDPIEVNAIGAVHGAAHSPDNPLLIGAVKTNIGHLEAAAGVAGLIKLVLMFQHGAIPANLHFHTPNPLIPWAALPVKVPTALTPWPPSAGPRVAGLSAFGFSGTNAHLILEAPPAREPAPPSTRPLHLLALSARDAAALRELARRYAEAAADPSAALADLCFTANTGRAHFAQRLAVSAASAADLRERLAAFARGDNAADLISGQVPTKSQPKVAFLFTGQGAQYAGMGRQLSASQPVFRAALERCAAVADRALGRSLLAVLFEDGARLNETAYTQPALFALEYALAELWRSWGIVPTAVLGHSVGEYVAACVAGVFSVEDGLALIIERGRLMQALPAGGAMLAVLADEASVADAIAPYPGQVSLAALNGPANTVIAGAGEAVRAIAAALAARGIKSRPLTVSHAFHSPLMDPMLDAFEQAAARVRYAAPQIRVVSNVTGQLAGAGELTSAGYWRRHVRQPVRFADSIRWLHSQGCGVLLEIGPKPTLLALAQPSWPAGGPAPAWLPSLREGRADWAQMLESLAALYVRGAAVDWTGFEADEAQTRRRLPLPTYPFQRSRYWFTLPAPQPPASRSADTPRLHPLLERRVRSSALRDSVFESELSAQRPAYLTDHQIYDTVIFPAAGLVEMALAAAQQLGPGPHAIEALSIHDPLFLPDSAGSARLVQLVAEPPAQGRAAFKILSLTPEGLDEAWRLHATGTLLFSQSVPTPQPVMPAAIPGVPLPVADYYATLHAAGVAYGPAFRGLRQLWRGENEAWGQIELPAAAGDLEAYVLHPALLDAGFQTLGAALPAQTEGDGDVYLPVDFKRLAVYGRVQGRAWVRVTTRPAGEGQPTLLGSLEIFAEDGRRAAEVQALTLQRATRQALRSALQLGADDWLYETVWRPQPLPEARPALSGRWVIFADRTALAEALEARLTAAGAVCQLVYSGPTSAAEAPNRWFVDPAQPEAVERVWHEIAATGAVSRLVYLWGSEAASADEAAVAALHLVQAVSQAAGPAQLWLVTRGGQPVAGRGEALAQAALWGLGRVIALEHPDLRCGCLDLDPAGEADEAAALLAELAGEAGEPQVARRQQTRYVSRLARSQAKPRPLTQPYEVVIPVRGVLDNLKLQPLTRRAPGPGEIEIEVRASGLNFRDVLNVLGMYPGDPGAPGTECAGVVTAVGAGVAQLKVGDSVMGIASGAFNSHALSQADWVVPKPARLSFAEAATIPIAYLTALYGLRHLAGLKPGARVLIHAAAGGVGLAAVHLARQAGAEIFGTAGSAEKRVYLTALGVPHVLNSRTLDFADEIRRLTGGRGVDVVLNALADDFIPASVSVLAADGCFLEIGKRGIWTPEQVKAQKPGATYFPYDLTDVLRTDIPLWRAMLQTVMADLERGALAPLPLKAFPAHELVDAFRYMAQAKHTGKVVVVHQPVGDLIRPDVTYLITGGLGGLGLKVAEWLVQQGARHLALVGRRPAGAAAQATLRDLELAGAQVRPLSADMSRPEAVARVLNEIAENMPPLRGLVHAAGVLADGVLRQQNRERFAQVLGPKVAGAWALHTLTRGLPLDFFVLFSSAASLLGSPGQGNYAAANAFMDALAHARRASGLPALSLNWGGWAEVGMAAALGERDQRRRAQAGIDLIPPERGVQAFGQMLRLDTAQVGLLPIHWPVFQQQLGQPIPPYWSEMVNAASARAPEQLSAPEAPDFLKQLAAAAPDGRLPLLQRHVQEQVARVFGLDPQQLADPHRLLSEMGMDSLMAVELRNRLQTSLGRSLPTTLAFDYPTIEALAVFLDAAGQADGVSDPVQVEAAAAPDADAALLAQVDELSDDQVSAWLDEMLAKGDPRHE